MKVAVLFLSILLLAQTPGPAGQMGCPQGGMMMQQHMGAARSEADRQYMQAMMQMHQDMMRESMTGDPDHDFLIMMIPHHQAAVDMCATQLKYGKNQSVQALCRSIIKTQQAEIRQMRSMLGSQ